MHGNGSPVAWLRRGAPIAVPAEPQQILVAFKNWLIDHPAVAGLAAMTDTAPLAGLTLWPTPPRSYGSLKTIRLIQSYRGLPVLGAGETVTLTVSPGNGLISVNGAIADAREIYAGWAEPMTPEKATKAALGILEPLQDANEVDPVVYNVADPFLVAIVEIKAMAYIFRLIKNGEDVGILMVRADNGAMLEFRFAAVDGLNDPAPVRVRARTFQSDPYALNDAAKQFVADHTDLDGEALQGSIYTPLVCAGPLAPPQCGQTRLGNIEIAIVDAQGQDIGDTNAVLTAPTSATGEFLAQPPAASTDPPTAATRAASMQDAFYRLQATFRLFAPFKAGRWDSLYGPMSDFPADEFVPRLVYFFDTANKCDSGAPFCAEVYAPFSEEIPGEIPTYDEHPWTDLPAHRPAVGSKDEPMVKIISSTESFRSIDLLFHEFGHFLDFFSAHHPIGQNIVGSGCMGVDPGAPCNPGCNQDSTDETDPLAETVADMLGLYAIGRLYPGLTYNNHCAAVSGITLAVGKPVHDPACLDANDIIASFVTERPSAPGTKPNGDGPIPTGKCEEGAGYRQSALLTAWWEWIHGQTCIANFPFTCTSFIKEELGASTGIEAMFYALNLTNKTYYRKFITDAETYLQCEYGDQGLDARWREVWCHHGALDCTAMPLPCPCGDGVALGTEACDKGDLAGKTCETEGFTGGALSCHMDCTVDTSACVGGPPTSGEVPTSGAVPTSDGGGSASSSDASSGGTTDSATGGPGGIDPGCDCTTTSPGGTWLLGLAPLLLRRRRRVLDSRVARG